METSKVIVSRLPEIPDHLLAEIFLRLPTPEDLARAAATCVPFRQLITEGPFLRRFRRLHAPPLLGFLDQDGFNPAVPPHPSAPAARELARAADFSFSFLPSHCSWTVQDVRDGRVLLCRTNEIAGHANPVLTELVVCDPLHRRYILLPPVPDALTAPVARAPHKVWSPWCEPFLVPLAGEAETAFGVILLAHLRTRLDAFIFDSSTRQWRTAVTTNWNDLYLGRKVSAMILPLGRHYAYGCFYWELNTTNKELLMLDTQSMEFSIVDLPPGEWTMNLAIVEVGEGRLGMFSIFDDEDDEDGKFDLCYSVRGNKGESSSQWQMQKTISLGSEYQHYIEDANDGYLLLGKLGAEQQIGSLMDLSEFEHISIDVKSLQFERVCSKDFGFSLSKTRMYTNFPPSLLSSPTV